MLPELNDCILDHVAIAVENLEKSVEVFSQLGLTFSDVREVVHEQNVKTAFAPIDENAHIELLEPTKNDSAIGKFIASRGQGIHHLCFKVTDIVQKQSELADKGFRFIYEAPKKGANSCLVNFIHPKSASGVLIEISQKLEAK